MQAFAKTLVLNSLIKDQSAAAQMAMTHYPSGMPNLRGLVYSSGGRYLPHSWLLAITLAISIAVALWVIHLMRRQHDEGRPLLLQSSVLCCSVTTLISTISHRYCYRSRC